VWGTPVAPRLPSRRIESTCKPAKRNPAGSRLAGLACVVTDYAARHPMVRAKGKYAANGRPASTSSISLKVLAEHLGLSSATVSLVINRSPGAKSIPASTQERVRAAARELNYRPNLMARSLRQKRSFTIGVLVPEVSEGYAALVLSGIEDHLLQEGYFYFVVSHRHRADLIEEYPSLLQQRAVEGIIAVDTVLTAPSELPAVAISGHREVEGVTNIILDHNLAAQLALEHLQKSGHTRIAMIKGQEFSSDTEIRWRALHCVATQLGIDIHEQLTIQLEGDSPSPEVGYGVTRKLLERGVPFTALLAFNDISAIGAIQALRESGKRVPEDVSVVGFDDIQSAAYQNPGLTTVRQPLRQMGVIAAETLLTRVNSPRQSDYPKEIVVKPEFIVRASTAIAAPTVTVS
jgi:DNA-binding LacI/PurR family transcriptional regulator